MGCPLLILKIYRLYEYGFFIVVRKQTGRRPPAGELVTLTGRRYFRRGEGRRGETNITTLIQSQSDTTNCWLAL